MLSASGTVGLHCTGTSEAGGGGGGGGSASDWPHDDARRVSSFQFPPDVPGRYQRQGHHDFMQGEMALWKGKGMVGRQSRQRWENFSLIVLFALYRATG